MGGRDGRRARKGGRITTWRRASPVGGGGVVAMVAVVAVVAVVVVRTAGLLEDLGAAIARDASRPYRYAA